MAGAHTLGITTPDGWTLRLRRLPGPAAGSGAASPPVLLLHGFGANGYALGRDAEPSLGRALGVGGRRCWVLEQRGTRSSRHPALDVAFARITAADKLRYDLPTAIDTVLEHERAERLDLVGHSLGGSLVLAYLAGAHATRVRRAVTIASAWRYRYPLAAQLLAAAGQTKLGSTWLPARVPLGALTRLGAATGLLRPARDHFNLENIEREVLLAMIRHGTEDVALAELASLTAQPGVGAGDRLFGPGLGLGRIAAPVLLIGGQADRHVLPADLAETWRRLGTGRKQLWIAGRRTGARFDYGHTDLLLGPRAPCEVFPHVARWLDASTLAA
jgi:pimeloyl-ACP methyl ester carboxylesterase